jgi:hypothetical protein
MRKPTLWIIVAIGLGLLLAGLLLEDYLWVNLIHSGSVGEP